MRELRHYTEIVAPRKQNRMQIQGREIFDLVDYEELRVYPVRLCEKGVGH